MKRTKYAVNFSIDKEIKEKIEEESKETRVKKSTIVNDILKKYFERN